MFVFIGALNLLLRKAQLLIENETNNASERLMNLVARFNMGKRLNLIQRGSYERRVYMSGLRYNKSFQWHSSPWKKSTGKSPGKHFKKFIDKHTSKKETPCRRKLLSEYPDNHKKNTVSKVKNMDYGINAQEPEEQCETDFIMTEAQVIVQQLQVSSYFLLI